MLKNKLIVKKIRNILIFIMAIAILIGTYTYVRRSRAENIIQVELEISDKSETLEPQKITVDATETQDGNYLLDLPTAVNGNIVTKYYTTDGAEVVMNDENADKTLTLTQTEVDDLKVQLQTDYDKKEIETEDGQIITLYNKELLAEKKTEEETSEETITEEGETNQETKEQNSTNEITENETMENELTESKTIQNETTENETTEGETTEEKVEFDDTVIVTGYMPLEAQVDIKEIDLSTLSEIQLPSDTQTMQKAYEVSVYQIVRRTFDVDGNLISEKTVMSQNLISDVANNEEEDTAVENETEGNEIAENENTNIQENSIIEDINAKNAKENENVESITEGTTPDNTTITTIMLKDGTRIEEEKMEYDPSIYNESIVIKTKNTEENTLATIYTIQEDNQIVAMESTVNKEYIHTTFSKDNQTIRYILAVEPNELPNEEIENDIPSSSGIETMAITDGNMLRSTSTETNGTTFLGNTTIQREKIDNVTFVDNIPEDVYDASTNTYINNKAWDVSAEEDNSIIAWYENNGNGSVKVYIGSNEKIYANTDSSYLFSYIGFSSYCKSTETITNLELLNTNNVTNMSYMFSSTGESAMTSLDLGENFDTSNVTDMKHMFMRTGFYSMTNLDLGEKFNTSKVTDMRYMFLSTGSSAMTSLDLGEKFDTSNVTNMERMFDNTGYKSMKTLDLGDKFDTSNVTNMNYMFSSTGASAMTSLNLGSAFTHITETNQDIFFSTGKSKEIVIQVPGEIYQDSTHFKLNANSNETIEFTRGTIILRNMLKSTSTETNKTSTFLGNTNIQREKVDNVTFMDYIPEDVYDALTDTYINSTAWDVTAGENKSILAWYETKSSGNVKVYIGSNEEIYANTDSSYLFADIGESNNCTETETITNISLLNTSNVTNMSHMFQGTGYRSMTSLNLGENFDTSNVTNMSYMFSSIGVNSMTSLDLGNNFDTSNVTDMSNMFYLAGYDKMDSLELGDKFDTSNVTDMSNMFSFAGYDKMDSLELGDKFDTSSVTNMSYMFYRTGFSSEKIDLYLGDKFDTSKVTDMSHMFMATGYNSMTSLDLGNKFDTSNVTNMSNMFSYTGYNSMTSLDLGDKFDTSNVTNMSNMFFYTGYKSMTSLYLGEKFDTSKVTNMSHMFEMTGSQKMMSLVLGDKFFTDNVTDMTSMFSTSSEQRIKTLNLGPAFTKIADINTGIFDYSGIFIILAPETIYSDNTNFKLNANSSTTIKLLEGNITPKYRTEWLKESTQIDETDINNPKMNITLRGTTNTEVASNEYISDVTSSLTTNDIKVYIDDTEITDIVTKEVGTATQIANTRTGAQDVLQVVTLSNFEEATRRTGKDYKEWSGNIRIEVEQGTLTDTTYGNSNMDIEKNGSRTDSQIEDATKVDKNTTNAMFIDYIEPEFTYQYSSTDINHEEKTLTVDFSVTDKYFENSEVLANAENITVKMLDTNVVPENLTKTLRKVQDITETRDGTEVKIGEKYRFVISGFEKASIDNGKYKEYSGPVSIVFPAGMVSDKSGNTNVQKNITVGIDEPDGTGDEEIVDFIKPEIEKIDSSVNVKEKTATLKFVVTDKYLTNSTLTTSNIQVLVNGSVNTTIEKQLTSTVLNEQRVVDGVNSTAQYGTEYTLTLSGIDTTVNQIKVRIPEGTLLDTSGNGNKEKDFIVFNTLRSTSTETEANSGFLGNTNIERQNITNVTFVSNTSGANSTAWDVSAMADLSIIAWYEDTYIGDGIVKVYIGSNDDIFGNIDSSYLFSWIGARDFTTLEIITNIELLNTGNVQNMSHMFEYAGTETMRSLYLGSNFDTSNVTDMSYMFNETGRILMTNFALGSNFDTSNVTNMSNMFANMGYEKLSFLSLGSKFDTSKVTDMSYMFANTGVEVMTGLDLGDKFDTSNVEYMTWMFHGTGANNMQSLDLGDKFNTNKVTDMSSMFNYTGEKEMTNLDLGPAFTNIASMSLNIFGGTGKSGSIIIQAPEAIYIDETHFEVFSMNGDPYIGFTRGKIEPKYRTEWIKEEASLDETETNNPKINITLRGTTNQEVSPDEYISDVTSSLTPNDIKVFIDNIEITDVVTKEVGSATQTDNARTGAKDVLQVVTLSNFEEATIRIGKSYKEWSGNIRIEVAQGTLSDTTGPADENGKKITYGNSNMEVVSTDTITGAETGAGAVSDFGARIDNIVQDTVRVDQNTEGVMFADFIKPGFVYNYSSTDINYEEKTLTVDFSVTDKYFKDSTVLTNQDNITVKMLDTNAVPENITKTLTKVEDITETREGADVKIGEKYRLVISGFEQASKAEDGKYKEYSGPVSILFPAGMASDKSGNQNDQKNITIGIDEPNGTGDVEIVDVVAPIWEAKNVNIDRENRKATVELYGTDKYYANNTLDINKIKVIIDGEEVTNPECVTKELSAPEVLTEIRDGENVPYGVKYTLTLSNWAEEDSVFGESGRTYREYSGNTELQIEAGTLVDESENENVQTTLNIGKIDVVSPDILKVSSNVDNENKKETIVFDVIDKEFETSQISTTDTSKIHVYVDDEEATTVTKNITNVEDVTTMVNGRNEVVGKRYTLELTNFEQPRTSINYNREYADWSGDVSIKIDAGIATDKSGNENVETTLEGDFVDFIKPNVTYQFTETDIDHDGKTFTMVFDITDKFYTSGTLALEDLAIRIDGEEPDWTEVNKALQVEDRTNEVNGESKVIGKRYTLILSNLEQLQVKEGDNYLEYSGVITVAIPADKVVDTTGNANDATTITSGISIPGGVVGEEEIVDVVNPLVEKMTSNVDVANKTAEITFKATDKYFENSTLTNENIQIVVNGSVNTSITKQLTSTPLNEQRVVDGTSSTVQYGVQYTLALTGLDTTVNQIKVRIPEGLITDQFGNGNKETDLIVFNTLRNTSTETNKTSTFLGNTNLQRQDVANVTFVDYIPDDLYNEETNTYLNNTTWDVSAMGDNSILAWCAGDVIENAQVYIGSNDEMFGNVDSSYLFSYIGAGYSITNIDLLNTSNVTNMSYMFSSTGYDAMTELDLGDNFDTSSATNMSNMFYQTGFKMMTVLDLGDKFDTSNVTNMAAMFANTGYSSMTSLDLGDKFDTSSVTGMNRMFYQTGFKMMTALDLGDNFDTKNVTDMVSMFACTGYNSMISLDLGNKFDTRNVVDMSDMFNSTGYMAMTSLDLGNKFDTRNATNMDTMFAYTGYTAMTSLDLGYKFDIRNVTNMRYMFHNTGYNAMTSLDLGPAFTKIAETNTDMFNSTGKEGEIVIQATEAIYNDSTNFKLNDGSNTTIEFTRGTVIPKYRTEWLKEDVQVDETEANNPKLNITLRGTTNTEIDSSEYISDVTSLLTPNDIKVYIDDTEITDVVTKEIGTATQTDNTRTGAKDILQVVTLSNFEEATIRIGKSYKEWSGNIRIEVAQGSLSDTTGPADEEGNKTTYGNKNMALAEDGSRLDNAIEDETKVDQNTEDVMFADFVKPGFVYNYSSTDINYEEKTLTVDFSVTDKYFKDSTVLTNQDNITVKMLDTNAVPENITKTLTKVEDITETREGADVKIGEKYRLVISGFEQASKAEDGKYKEYSGPVSIIFPAGMVSDKSGNQNDQKNITIGIDEPNGTGDAEIVDVVAPIWEAKNVNIDRENHEATVELYGTDKYYANNTLDINKIKVIVDGEEVTNPECVTKELSAPEILTEVRDEETVPYGVKYTLTLSNWKESDASFQASEKIYREYSGNTEIQIQAGTLVDESGNENLETTIDLGMIDLIDPEIYQISSTKDETEKTATIIFEVVDKYFESAQISTTDTSKLTIFVDNEEAIGVTKTITNEEDITTTVAGNNKVVGKRYTLVISNFEQPRTTIDYDREYSDWSGNVTVKIGAGTIVDESGNSN